MRGLVKKRRMVLSQMSSQLVRRLAVRVYRRGAGMWQRRLLRSVEVMAVTCDQAMAAPMDGRVMARGVVAKNDPREGHGSLMMLDWPICMMRLTNNMVTRWGVCTARMMVTGRCTMVIRIVGATVVVVIVLLLRLSLAVLLVLHPPILEPDLYLSLCEIQVPRQLPSFLL